MIRSKSTRLRAALALAIGALALLALASFAIAKDHGDGNSPNRSEQRDAGTISAFDEETGRLVIDLVDGGSVSGLVTNRTRIRCEDEHAHDSGKHRRRHRHHHGHDDSVSQRRSHGESEPGDDHGGGDNSGPGSEHSGQSGNDDNGSGANCTTADLIVGAVVEEAELEIEHGHATFDEVELAD